VTWWKRIRSNVGPLFGEGPDLLRDEEEDDEKRVRNCEGLRGGRNERGYGQEDY